MRLREIQIILSKADFENGRLIRDSSGYFSNINGFKKFVSEIKGIPIYSEEVSDIEDSELYVTTSNVLNVSNDERKLSIMSVASYLFNSADALYKSANKLIDKLDDNSISVKLRNLNDYNLLVSDMADLQKCISQIILHPKIDGKLEIDSWENGSRWLNLYLGSVLAVGIVASAAWSGAVVYKKAQEGRIFAEYARGLAIKNDSVEEIAAKQQEAISALVSEEAKRIQVKFYDEDEDNENFERIKFSIKLFSELVEKGTEVHPALTAPESVQNLFPDFKNLESIVSQTKLLTDKHSSN